MARRLLRGLCYAAIAAALALQGCGKSPRLGAEGERSRPTAARAATVDTSVSRPDALSGRTGSRNLAASAPAEQPQAEDTPPWLAELLHASDPNVRIQALDAWARQPGASLDPVTYALVDPDASVRARAQEVLEEELARR